MDLETFAKWFPTENYLPPAVDAWFSNTASSLGVPVDQLHIVFAFFTAVPLAEIFKRLPNATSKHLFSIIIGGLFTYIIYGPLSLFPLLHALLVYVLCKYGPVDTIPILVFIISMSACSASQIWRIYMFGSEWRLDISCMEMILVCKLCTYAYNMADGYKLKAGQKLHNNDKIHQYRMDRAQMTTPSLVEFLSFILFFPCACSAAPYEIREFLEFSDMTLFKKHNLSSIPSTGMATIRALLNSIIFFVLMNVSSMFNLMYMTTDEFALKPLYYKWGYFLIGVPLARCKYYCAWYMGEMAYNACGFGFNGVKKDEKGTVVGYLWNRMNNIDPIGVEFSSDSSTLINSWNIRVNDWLKYYVYQRVEAPKFISRYINSRLFANIVTKATSAFWHGFFLTYYVFFLSSIFSQMVDDALQAAFLPLVSIKNEQGKTVDYHYPGKYLYNVVAWFLISSCLNFYGIGFLLLEWDLGMKAFANASYIGYIVPLVVIPICSLLTPKKTKNRQN